MDGTCIGSIGITPGKDEYKHSWELGYWIGEPCWGKGIGTIALQLMTDYAFVNTDAQRLFATVLSPNVASIRILEKCGYQLEGVLRSNVFRKKEGQFMDECLFSRIRS